MSKRSQTAYRGPFAIGRAVQLFLAGQLRSLQKTAPDLEHSDPAVAAEAVHDLRVDCQQMRSVLQAFSGFLPETETVRLDKRIRRLQRVFRTVRDRHILLAQPELPPDLRQTLEKEQDEAMRSLLQTMDSRHFSREAEELCRKILDEKMEIRLSPEPLTKKGAVQLHRLDAVAPVVLYRLAAAITAYRAFIPDQLAGPAPETVAESVSAVKFFGFGSENAPAAADAEPPRSSGASMAPARFWEDPDWPSATVLHRLRLSWKHLRHVLMMLCPLWGDLGDSLIATCKEMQDQLGHLHDRQLFAEALVKHAGTAAGGESVAAVWPGIMSGQADAMRAFLERWRGMDLAWFHTQLQPMVEWSVQHASLEEGQADGQDDGPAGGPADGPAGSPAEGPVEGGNQAPPEPASDKGGALPEGPSIDDGRERESRLAAIYREAADDWPD